MAILLTRDDFRNGVFERDNHHCVICKEEALDAHHILERRLFPDGGYYLNNGASLCEKHHLLAESTQLSCDEIRSAAGITEIVLPPHFYTDVEYDKWGNEVLANEIMKKFLTVSFLFIGLLLNAQNPVSLDLNIGDSELRGLTGLELQMRRYALNIGWRPGITPEAHRINSFSTGLTIYGNTHFEFGYIYNYYISAGYASEGFIYSNEFPFFNSNFKVVPSAIIMVGIKSLVLPKESQRLAMKVGIGDNISEHGSKFAFEVVISYTLFK